MFTYLSPPWFHRPIIISIWTPLHWTLLSRVTPVYSCNYMGETFHQNITPRCSTFSVTIAMTWTLRTFLVNPCYRLWTKTICLELNSSAMSSLMYSSSNKSSHNSVHFQQMASTPLNMHMSMHINMLNFRPQLVLNCYLLTKNIPPIQPSVHHLSSAPLPSVTVNMEYTHDDLAHPQYIVTTQPDMMLSQQAIAYQQQVCS